MLGRKSASGGSVRKLLRYQIRQDKRCLRQLREAYRVGAIAELERQLSSAKSDRKRARIEARLSQLKATNLTPTETTKHTSGSIFKDGQERSKVCGSENGS